MAKKKTKKKKEYVEEVFVRAVVREGEQYTAGDYLQEMLNVGVKDSQLRLAAYEFALDNINHLFSRLNNTEILQVKKRLKKIFNAI